MTTAELKAIRACLAENIWHGDAAVVLLAEVDRLRDELAARPQGAVEAPPRWAYERVTTLAREVCVATGATNARATIAGAIYEALDLRDQEWLDRHPTATPTKGPDHA